MELDDPDLSEDEKLARVMGFKKFSTTKETKIPGNEFNYAVRKEKQTKYRQYMNRQGGFNRPLSPSR
jgi:U4/U6.U5 tri-snRNP-associated protein 3